MTLSRTIPCLVLLSVLAAGVADAQPKDGGVQKERVRVAVLPFEPSVSDPDLKLFGQGLSALMINDLTGWDQVRVVERERIEEVMGELKLGETRFADKSSFAKIGKGLGVRFLVLGILLRDPKTKAPVIVARLVDTEVWDIRGIPRVIAADDDVLAAIDTLSASAGKLLASLASVTERAEPEKKTWKLPAKTLQNYARALEAKDKKDTATATKLLTDVVKETPDFKLAQLDLLSLTK
ncbi:MAG: CsgG/HfaB family protein [Myxococcaceae bacterium]